MQFDENVLWCDPKLNPELNSIFLNYTYIYKGKVQKFTPYFITAIFNYIN